MNTYLIIVSSDITRSHPGCVRRLKDIYNNDDEGLHINNNNK